ncbi:MAG TPA: STAS domain-containing protein [Gaiellaceae bacterium]|nr:STAS domain-containing protein [Gaiellaceae bacterium]
MGDVAHFAVETLEDCVVVRVEGDLDMATVASFDEAVESTASDSHLAIDLRECTFLDSSGMRSIAAAANRHPRVSVVAIDPGILRVLEITALDTMLPVHASLDEVR